MKLIMENWRKFLNEENYFKQAVNLAIGDAVDAILYPADVLLLHNFAKKEAKRQYPKPSQGELKRLLKQDRVKWRKGQDQAYYQEGFRHILGAFIIEHKKSVTPTEFLGKRYEDGQYLYKNLADLVDPGDKPRHDPDDRKADEANNLLGIALADKYENYRFSKNSDYIQIVKEEHMDTGDFWTKSTLGSGKILKYKDLLIARKSKDSDADKKLAAPIKL